MEREEAINIIRDTYHTDTELDALKVIIPELRESEDERIRKGIIEIIKAVSGPDCDVYLDEKKQEKYIAWLEKQKEQEHICDSAQYEEGFKTGLEIGLRRQKEQKPAEWSEEDEEMLEEIINHIDTTSVQRIPARPGSAIGKSWIKFLKSIRPQPKQEWSEEDEDMLNCCISSIEEAKENRYAYKETDGDTSYDHEIDWLKSLRPSWKPSEEQMKILEKAVAFFKTEWTGTKIKEVLNLESLYEQLKKLKSDEK